MTVDEHIKYWIESAKHDLETANTLFESHKYDWCLFIGHLVLEKALKAAFVKNNSGKIPPKIHNLVRLAELARIELNDEQLVFLDEVNDFNLEVRYPDFRNEFHNLCTNEFTEHYFSRIKEFYKWLISRIQ